MNFFIGAVTAQGYISFAEDMRKEAEHTYDFGRAPRHVRQAMMNVILDEARESGEAPVIFKNQIIPDDMDGIFLPISKIFIANNSVDGPDEFIQNKNNNSLICDFFEAQRGIRRRAVRYLSAAADLLQENRSLIQDACYRGKIVEFAHRMAARTLRESARGNGLERRVFLTCVTGAAEYPEYPVNYEDTIRELADKIYVIEDESGAISRIILQIIRKRAIELNLDIITGFCGLHGDEEHILIPELNTAFCTSNKYHPIKNYTIRHHVRRFTDRASLLRIRGRLKANRQSAKELISGGGFLIGQSGICAASL